MGWVVCWSYYISRVVEDGEVSGSISVSGWFVVVLLGHVASELSDVVGACKSASGLVAGLRLESAIPKTSSFGIGEIGCDESVCLLEERPVFLL